MAVGWKRAISTKQEYQDCNPIAVKLPWIFQGTPLKFNGAPGNIQGNLTPLQLLTLQIYHQTSNIRTLVANKLVDHPDVV